MSEVDSDSGSEDRGRGGGGVKRKPPAPKVMVQLCGSLMTIYCVIDVNTKIEILVTVNGTKGCTLQ